MRKPVVTKLIIYIAVIISLQVNALEWDGDCKTCCKLPKDFANGRLQTTKKKTRGLSIVPERSILQFKCNDQYELTGAKRVTCKKGAWSQELPICIAKYCFMPPPLENGRTVSNFEEGLFLSGTEISYECNEGYGLGQHSTLVCGRRGNDMTWTGEMPQCKKIVKCEDPGEDSKGHQEGPCCEIGDVIKYSCVEKYEIIGPSAILCTEAGIWNSTRPRCQPEIFCSVPDRISYGQINGTRDGDFYVPDDSIMIICDEGYTVGNKSDYLFCDTDGKWDEDIPECKPIDNCSIPELPENGYIFELINDENITSFPYSFEINFACHPGYRLIGNTWRSCGAYGWTHQKPSCEEIQCPDPGRPENGWTQGTDYRIGNITRFGCYSGYNLLGSARRVCMENGQWSGELSRCDTGNNHCPNPGTPVGGTKFGNRYDIGSEVTFHCDRGRILFGSGIRTCQLNGTWSGDEVKCFGQNDFDDKRAVGYKIKSLLKNENMIQEVELNDYMSQLQVNDSESLDFRSRAIDLNQIRRLIFIFIFDASGSVGERNFNRSIDFAKAMVKVIRVSEEGTRVGAITFSSKATKEFLPVDYNNPQDVIEALDKIKYKKGGTAASSALYLLKEHIMPLSLKRLGEKSKFIVFVMTDGKVNMAGDPVHDAEALRKDDVEIYCVGITGDRNMKTLYDIASPEDNHVFILDGYESMNWLVQEIVNETIDYSKCGVRQSTVIKTKKEDERGRVFNGKEVIKPWPWVAAIFVVKQTERGIRIFSDVICGASIIDRKWILTAAHCMHRKDPFIWREENELIVRLGLTDINNTTYLQQRSVLQYITHPSYNRSTFDYDIALIELSEPAKYNQFVRPVCLPPPENDLHNEHTFYSAGQTAAVVGWGDNRILEEGENAHSVEVAKRITVSLQNRRTCRDSLKNRPKNNIFTDQMICAGGKDRQDACHGDSGGPLMQSLQDDIGEEYWTEVGIVSWGIGCGQIGTYGFYTKVSMFVDWIYKTMNDE